MFDHLIASTPGRGGAKKSLPSFVTSLSIHGGIVWVAVVATIKTAAISDRKRAEKGLIEVREELEQRVQQRTQQLREANRRVSRWKPSGDGAI